MRVTKPLSSSLKSIPITNAAIPPRRRFKPSLPSSNTPSTSLHPPSIDLISSPCPLSNLRAVYYAPLFPSLHLPPSRSTTHHPYSLSEFPRSDSTDLHLQKLREKLNAQDLEWRLHRYRVDAFNQDFWSRTNTNFLRARDEYVASLPPAPTSEVEEPVDLAPFYKEHLKSTKKLYAKYNRELWIATAGLLWPAVKAVAREWRWKWEVYKAGEGSAGMR